MDKPNHNNKEHKEHKEFREQKEAQAQKPDVRINWDIEKKSLREENEKLKEENKHLNDKFLRLAADFDNARKRWEKDREETIKFGTYKILKDLIVFMDELERAIGLMADNNHKDHQHTFVEGVAMTGNKLKDLLISEGVKELNPVGEAFDPYAHEILAQEEKEGVKTPTVAEVFQKGYFFNEKLLRTAKVKVYIPVREKEAAEPTPEETVQDGKEGNGTSGETDKPDDKKNGDK